MIIRCRLLSFTTVTVCEVLLKPIDSVPKLMDVGLTFTFARATLVKQNRIATTVATVFKLILFVTVIFM